MDNHTNSIFRPTSGYFMIAAEAFSAFLREFGARSA